MNDLFSVPSIAVRLFAIMDPFSVLPYILSLYYEYSKNAKENISWNFLVNRLMIAIVSLLVVFSLMGRPLLSFLGLSPEALEIGGGIILVYLGVDTMGGFTGLKFLGEKIEEALVTPIGTPLIVGPGTLTALVTLSVSHSPIVLLISSAIAAAITYLSLLAGPLIVRVLGNTGTVAAGRFTAIIIAAFGVQLILNALSEIHVITT